jgi:hypothetical protein
MKFMMIVKANETSETGCMPSEELIGTMGKYNERLMNAGVLIDLAGLQPSSKGMRIRFANGKQTLIDGPFAETKELIAGYWLINVKSREEAVEWFKQVPAPFGKDAVGEIELRQLFEMDDFEPCAAVEHQKQLGERLAATK